MFGAEVANADAGRAAGLRVTATQMLGVGEVGCTTEEWALSNPSYASPSDRTGSRLCSIGLPRLPPAPTRSHYELSGRTGDQPRRESLIVAMPYSPFDPRHGRRVIRPPLSPNGQLWLGTNAVSGNKLSLVSGDSALAPVYCAALCGLRCRPDRARRIYLSGQLLPSDAELASTPLAASGVRAIAPGRCPAAQRLRPFSERSLCPEAPTRCR